MEAIFCIGRTNAGGGLFDFNSRTSFKVRCSLKSKLKFLRTIYRASGHVDRFADLMTKDVKTGECFRLDHLIKAHLEKISANKKTPPEVKAECEDIVIKVLFFVKTYWAIFFRIW